MLTGKVADGGPNGLKSDDKITKGYLAELPRGQWFDIRMRNEDASKALEQIRDHLKQQKEFLELVTEYNNIETTMSKTLDKFYACVSETEDDILLAKFNQTRTQTHRLSSSGLHYKVQLQNQDNRFKPIFSPRNEGWYIGEADEGQLEYRVAVQDKVSRRTA